MTSDDVIEEKKENPTRKRGKGTKKETEFGKKEKERNYGLHQENAMKECLIPK